MKNTGINPVVVFAGEAWEASLLKSLLEDNEIETFLKDEVIGTMAPWYTGAGGAEAVKVVVADTDLERARQVVEEFIRNRSK
jgi:hypothetical protein